jgi:hypothetical protein
MIFDFDDEHSWKICTAALKMVKDLSPKDADGRPMIKADEASCGLFHAAELLREAWRGTPEGIAQETEITRVWENAVRER